MLDKEAGARSCHFCRSAIFADLSLEGSILESSYAAPELEDNLPVSFFSTKSIYYPTFELRTAAVEGNYFICASPFFSQIGDLPCATDHISLDHGPGQVTRTLHEQKLLFLDVEEHREPAAALAGSKSVGQS